MCEILAKRSTCLRIQTASIIVKNNIIVSVGYNGTASGQQHCCDYWKEEYKTVINVKPNISFEDFLKTNFFYHHHHLPN